MFSSQFNSLNKEIDSKNEEIKTMQMEKQKLENVIKSLEKDIHGLKKEIQERDETIQDKVKAIFTWQYIKNSKVWTIAVMVVVIAWYNKVFMSYVSNELFCAPLQNPLSKYFLAGFGLV